MKDIFTKYAQRKKVEIPELRNVKRNATYIYNDEECTDLYCEFPAGSNPPRKGCKHIMINCYNWKIVWVD